MTSQNMKKSVLLPEEEFEIMPNVIPEYILDENYEITVLYNPEFEKQFDLRTILISVERYVKIKSYMREYSHVTKIPQKIYETLKKPISDDYPFWDSEDVNTFDWQDFPLDSGHVLFYIDLEKKEIWEAFDDDDERFAEFISMNTVLKKALIYMEYDGEEPFKYPENTMRLIIQEKVNI